MRDSEEWERGARVDHGPGGLWRSIAAVLAGGGARAAVVRGARSLSFAELDARTSALAGRLRAAGVGAERPVAVLAEDGVDQVVACLAVFRAGGVYLPVDPAWPAGRRAAVLADAGPAAVVVGGALDGGVAGTGALHAGAPGAGSTDAVLAAEAPVLPVHVGDDEGAEGVPWPEPERDQAAYLVYTSGSTGRPKGVLVTHGALANRMLWWQGEHPLGPDDVLMATASPAFDIAVWELLAAFVGGARLVIAEHRLRGVVPHLPELMTDHRVTVAHFVPSVLEELLGWMADGGRVGLRLVVCGGEAVPPSQRDRLLALSGARMVHAYGPTETTITVVHDECRADDPAPGLPLGRPMHNAAVAVVDADGRRAPVGVAGELVVGGVPLARGYLGRPGETAARFVPDWLGLGPAGGRVYRTRDRARRLPDGRIEFLGRVDDEFKVRGHRVDPAEIESLLHQHPLVGRAAVRLADGAHVVAYLQGSADPAELRAHLADRLPLAVIPTRWVRLDRFPLTPNGKVDYAALPAAPARANGQDGQGGQGNQHGPDGPDSPDSPDGRGDQVSRHDPDDPNHPNGQGSQNGSHGQSGLPGPHGRATTALERELAELWARDLGLDAVGVSDDFLALGGHSLLATRTAAAAWRRRRVRLSPADVLSARTVAALARRIEELAVSAPEPAAATADEAPAELPLTSAQERILFEEEFLGGPGLFTVPVPTRWRGPVRVPELRTALDALVRRHPVLRAALADDGGPVRLVLHEAAPVPLVVEDLRALAPAAREARVVAAGEEAAAEPFDLHRPPLLRARLLRLADEEHVFLPVLHHLVCDRWSMRLLAEDLRELYASALDGRAPRLGPAASPVAVPRAGSGHDLDHWLRRLDGAALDGDLAVGPRHRADHGHRAGRVLRLLPAERTAALNALCAARGVTPFVVLLAAFQVLLHRFSDSDDVVVAVPVDGRDAPGAYDVVTMLVNTVPLRADLRGDPRFSDVLDRARDEAREAVAHQAAPMGRLAGALGLRRGAGHHSLMRHMLVWEDSLGVPVELPGVVAEPMRPPSHTTAFDLTLIARAVPDGVDLELEFNHDVLDAASAALVADGFTALVDHVLADPDVRIGRTRLTGAPVEPVLAGPVAPPAPPVLRLVRDAAARRPDAPAVVDGEVVTGYAELVRRADAVAARIRAAGGGPGDVVGVCLPRSTDLVAALLGVLAAGRAFLPLSPEDPDDRITRQLDLGGARLVIAADADRFAADRFAGVTAVSPLVPAEGAGEAPLAPLPEPLPGDAAYVIFTSGSTGEPKGVVVEHRALADHVRWAVGEYGLTAGDRALQFCAVAFDVLVEEVLPTLASGAAVVLRDEESATSAQALVELCAARGVTVANLPTGYWERLVAAFDEDGTALPPSVRLVVIGGQQVDRSAVERWHRLPNPVRLVNAYGPTEMTIGATAADLVPGGGVPIGGPTENTRAYLLDRYLAPVPDGVVAELYLAGSGLARGYSRRPGLTGERFLPDPFAGGGQRMYRTGDLAVRRDGALHFIGRVDRQVKVRGHRIELDEVESALTAAPGVAEAAVLLRGGRLVAHVAAPPEVDGAGLRAHLAGRLPAFMVPSVVVVSRALPRTSTGKVDRNALTAEPDEPADLALPGDDEPGDERERATSALWAQVLGVARVGVRDSFFDLGGHSLLAMDLVRLMHGQGYRRLRVPDLFEHPTIEALAPWADDAPTATGTGATEPGATGPGVAGPGVAAPGAAPGVVAPNATVPGVAAPGAVPDATAPDATAPGAVVPGAVPSSAVPSSPVPPPVPDSAPLSWAQLGIWAHAAVSGSRTFHLPVVLRLSGPLSESDLAGATAALTARHDLLRSALADGPEGPEWRPARNAPVPLGVLDAPAPDLAERIAELVAEPFDLRAAPPVRWTLLRLGPDDAALVVVLHHIAGDGWSAGLLVRELAELYAARTGRRPAALPPAPSFLALAAADRSAPPDRDGLAFWTEALRGAPDRMDLPADRLPAEPRDPGRHRARVPLPPATASALAELARRERATPFMVLLAGVQAWLARCCRQSDVVVGAPVADRDDDVAAGVLGPLVNVLPVRVRVDPARSFAGQVARTRAAALAVFEHRSTPTQQIVRHLGLSGRGLSHVVFDLDEAAGPETTAFGGVTARTVPQTPALGAFDLEVTARQGRDGLSVELRAAADLFGQAGVEHLAAALARLLTGVAERPDAPLRSIDLLGDDERRRLLVGLNARHRPERPEGVLALVADWVARTPDATAVTAPTGRLTYRELDALSDGVAGWLRDRGLPAEGLVATRLGRCLELPAVVLGIWKAGGAYVPLDPAQPAERHRRILADCRPRAVVADRDDPVFGDTPLLTVADLRPGAPAPVRPPEPDRLAYVAYTSGSTGEPKGVQCAHHGLANQLMWSRRAYPLNPGEALAQVAAVGFDISLWELLHPLTSGGRLVVLDQERHGDVVAIAELVAAERVVVLHLVPTLLEHYLDEGPADSLRHVVCGGERLSPGLPARFAARTPAALNHTYGPTEASIIVTHWRSPDPAPDAVSLGAPLPGARVYLLDPHGQPVPVGVVGELVLGGEVLARGYLGRPGATAERFLPDPFSDVPGARAYRTGDLARHRPDGGLEFVGRADRQVKILGVRVEPHEVETALVANPAVAACAVLPREDARGAVGLVGYLVPADRDADPDRLRAEVGRALRERLPRAMVPSRLVVLEALPVGPTGKLDVGALPEPDEAPAPLPAPSPTGPGTAAERDLAAIWAQVLPVPGDRVIGPQDNFFELGGDSVSAIRVVARARAAGLRVELGRVLRAGSLAELAASASPVEAPVAVRPAPPDARLWLTPAQRRFLATAVPGHFNQAVLTEPAERVDPEALRAALQAVAAHHDAFRLRPVRADGRRQDHAVLAPRTDDLVVVLTAGAPFHDDSADELAAPAHRAVDVDRGPLLAALLAERPDGGQVVLLTAHHLAIDTASWETVLSDLDIAYRQVARGEQVVLPTPITPFADLARALPAFTARLDTPAQRAHWHDQLADLPPLPGATGGGTGVGSVLLALGEPATRALTAAASRHRLRVDELLLAALVRVIARWTGSPRVGLLREAHGRSGPPDWPDLTGTVGWLTAVYPVRVDLPADEPLAALHAVREALGAVPDGGVGYGLLHPDPEAEPDLVVNYLGATTGGPGSGLFVRAARQAIGGYAAGQAAVRGVEVIAGIDERGLWVEWLHDRERFPESTVDSLAEGLRVALAELVPPLEGPFGVAAVPTDFPAARVPGDRLRAVLAARSGVRDVLPLSPAQQGMLAWHLARPGSVAYHTQILFAADGDVDEARLRAAWQRVVDRTDVFRTAFVHTGLEEPVQVVGASPPVDWRGHAGAGPDEVLAADRDEPFDLSAPGQQRWHWIDGGAAGRWLLWSHHHILLDGWSLPLVLADVAAAYTAGPAWAPPRRPGYGAYLSWLSTRDEEAGAAFWRGRLAGATPTRLGRAGTPGAASLVTADLPEAATRALTGLAERSRATLHSVVLAAWSLVLGLRCASDDVVFGVVMSLRPDEIPDSEHLVGLCLNTVPLRVRVDADGELPELFRRIQQDLVEGYQHAAHPLGRVRGWAGAPDALFDSIVVFENYPGDRTGQALGADGALRVVRAVESTEFAVSLTVLPDERLTFELTHLSHALTSAEAGELVRRLARLLERIAESGGPEGRRNP
ncbi:amino acid adenylation domain-containing protein [Actinosynnema pretiosum subsp. pretiosum]|uniref:Amino acid adenylation domain-containing protein n=1 Tax=Actinosynnema pretiosum subsp. pretiosum TaxID=103721 RepID=A0AA45R3Y1_9PSEU|nr:amino acid adenylation domain-containing protein [Actinosynnema pretiosum subsp. pretiosum]